MLIIMMVRTNVNYLKGSRSAIQWQINDSVLIHFKKSIVLANENVYDQLQLLCDHFSNTSLEIAMQETETDRGRSWHKYGSF
jgi:hypothetical protein